FGAREMREEHHRKGVRLFAGRAAGAPRADRSLALARLRCPLPLREDRVRQVLEVVRLAEEVGLVRRDAIDHPHELFLVATLDEELVIFAERRETALANPPREPPVEERALRRVEMDPA